MGFLRKTRKYNNEDKPIDNSISENNEDESLEYDEEDDFSPIIKKPKKPTEEEFRNAAFENFKAAADTPAENSKDDASIWPKIEETGNTADDEEQSDENNSGTVSAEAADEAVLDQAIEITDTPETEPEGAEDDEDDFEPANEPPVVKAENAVGVDSAVVKEKKHSIKDFIGSHRGLLKGLFIGLGALMVVCLIIYIYGCITVPKDRMGRNIYIENINVSNLTYDEALERVKNEPLLSNQNLTVICNGETYTIAGSDAGLTAELEATVDKAMRYGKTNNILIDGFANSLQIFVKHKVVPNANVDETIVREKLADFGHQLYGELIEHNMEIGDGVIICTPGKSGFDNNTDAAWDQLKNAIANEQFDRIKVSLLEGSPKDLTVEDVDNFAWAEEKDATFELVDNQISIVPEQDGRIIDKDQTAGLVTQIKEGGEVVEIPFTSIPAAVTAAELEGKLFNATIGSYSTSYGTSTANRCANVANAASKINGKILLPGEVFSFNDTVGPRSVANGFYTAKEYVDGQTVDGIGGGTCQVSSTLYNAVLYSDISIVSRTNHMFPVGYCPLGQDATVADTGVDFKFVNSMDYPIKISAVTGGYKITVSIIGTQRDDPRTVKITNSSTMVGNDTKVSSVRYVYNSAGELISKDQLPGSYYRAHTDE
ncbi:MAG: VanW family protein [Oscillospiraceae bacterium]|nr:VanW family protein [Oscillospiraceae bacterium]